MLIVDYLVHFFEKKNPKPVVGLTV